MRQPSAEEIEDARVETMIDRERRDRLMRGHAFDPTCGCECCEPLSLDDGVDDTAPDDDEDYDLEMREMELEDMA